MKAAKYGIMLMFLSGCVSVSFSEHKTQHASDVKFEAPPPPYEKVGGDNVDQIWRNTKNGNAVSFLSDCNDESDPPLSTIEQGVLSGLYPYTYRSQVDTTFDGRTARRISVEGQVDGVASIVDLLIFKRNSCIFILTFAGIEQYHHQDGPVFDHFITGFHAP